MLTLSAAGIGYVGAVDGGAVLGQLDDGLVHLLVLHRRTTRLGGLLAHGRQPLGLGVRPARTLVASDGARRAIVAAGLAGKQIAAGGGAHHHVQLAGALHDGNGLAEEHVREVDAVHAEYLIARPQTRLPGHAALLGELHEDARLPFGPLAYAQAQLGARRHMQHHIDVPAGRASIRRRLERALRGRSTHTGQLDHAPGQTLIRLAANIKMCLSIKTQSACIIMQSAL